MGKEVSRRDFLKITGAVLAGIATGGIGKLVMDTRIADIVYHETHETDPQLHIDFEKNNEQLTFEELAALEQRLGRAYQVLDIGHWRPHLTDEFIANLQKEVSYQLIAEDISSNAITPDLKSSEPYTKLAVNHELGSTDCMRVIYENLRYHNEASDLYDSPSRIGEIVHETAHLEAQGDDVCHDRSKYDLKNIEGTAQMVMFEILAYMINRGNRTNRDMMLRSFVFESFTLVDGALFYRAVQDKRLDEYENLRRSIIGSAYDEAREGLFRREYASDPFTLNSILEDYYLYPIQTMIEAHRTSNDIVDNVALPPRHTNFSYDSEETYPATLLLDDWAYVMDHLDELVDQAAREDKNS